MHEIERRIARIEAALNLPDEPTDIPRTPSRHPAAAHIERAFAELIHRHDPTVRVHFRRPLPFPRKINAREDRAKYSWCPTRWTLTPACETYESALHDVAHWLTAGPERLLKPEFGLGVDPYRTESDAQEHTLGTDLECRRIERDTCQLSILLTIAVGLSVEAVCSEVNTALPMLDEADHIRTLYPNAMTFMQWEYVMTVLRAEAA